MGSKLVKKLMPLLLTSMTAGVVLTILGPFGTSRLSFIERAVYWVGLCVAGGLGTAIIDIISSRLNWTLKNWQLALGQSIGATLCVTAILFIMFPPNSMPGVFVTLFYVWVIAIVICSFGTLMHSRKAVADAPDANDKRPDILDRLPPKLRSADIYAISAEDHYVRVHTSKGDEMVLMRLSDAIKEMSPLIGEQVHRSWWVAEIGIEKAERKNGKTQIKLKNDVIAPVSRSGQKAVKEAGWL